MIESQSLIGGGGLDQDIVETEEGKIVEGNNHEIENDIDMEEEEG